MNKLKKISVIGLGKLGATLTAVLASKGFQVIGLDTNPKIVQLINHQHAPVNEPGLQELISAHHSNIHATTDYHDAILNSDVTFIVVPTPSDSDGKFSNQFILQAIREIGHELQKKSTYHLIAITSTVMPGSTNGEIKHILEESSLKKVGEKLGLCYNPEFISFGSVIKNMLYPDMILIGESDHHAGSILKNIYQAICQNQAPVMRMNLINAEITKIAVNTFITTKISFANMLSDLCDRLPDADVDTVTTAMGMDTRIGHQYLKGATSYGGPCFPRDNNAFCSLATELGAKADIALATDAINQYQLDRLYALITKLSKTKSIGILGLAYKPNTDLTEESMGIALANLLAENNYQVSVYDPMAIANAKKSLHDKVIVHSSRKSCTDNSELLVITTNWPEFNDLVTDLLQNNQQATIIDCWRSLPQEKIKHKIEIHYLGFGPKEHTLRNTHTEMPKWTLVN